MPRTVPRSKALTVTYGCGLAFSVVMAVLFFFHWNNARAEGAGYQCLFMDYETKRFYNYAETMKSVMLFGWINYLLLTVTNRMGFDAELLTALKSPETKTQRIFGIL